jgi:hypothetical protein
MNPWEKLHNDFNALKEAEDGIVRERVPAAHGLCVCWRSRHRREGCHFKDESRYVDTSGVAAAWPHRARSMTVRRMLLILVE